MKKKAFIIALLMSSNSLADVKRYISVKSYKQTGSTGKFRTSFNQQFPISCDAKTPEKKVTLRAFKTDKKKYMVMNVPTDAKSIKCYYRLK